MVKYLSKTRSERMRLLLIATMLLALLSAIKDKYYIELLQAEIEIRDIIIKDCYEEDSKK